METGVAPLTVDLVVTWVFHLIPMDLMQLELEQICNWIILTTDTTVLVMIARNVPNLPLRLLPHLLRLVEDVHKVRGVLRATQEQKSKEGEKEKRMERKEEKENRMGKKEEQAPNSWRRSVAVAPRK